MALADLQSAIEEMEDRGDLDDSDQGYLDIAKEVAQEREATVEVDALPRRPRKEEQPTIPGTEEIVEATSKQPTFDAPFSLERQAAAEKAAQTNFSFGEESLAPPDPLLEQEAEGTEKLPDSEPVYPNELPYRDDPDAPGRLPAGQKTVPREQVVARIAKVLKQPIGIGKTGPGARGFFRRMYPASPPGQTPTMPKRADFGTKAEWDQAVTRWRTIVGGIRVKWAGDVRAQLHELGHALDIQIMRWSADNVKGAIAAELEDLGAPTSAESYTAIQKRREGVAEYVYRYLVQPGLVREQAPNFTRVFERFLAEDKQIGSTLRWAQERFDELLNRSPEDALDDMFDWGDRTIRERVEEGLAVVQGDPANANDPRGAWSRVNAAANDSLYRLFEMESDIKGLTHAELKESGDSLYYQFRLLKGSAGEAMAFLYGTVRDKAGNVLGPGLYKALGPAFKKYKRVGKYMAARRAQRAEELGKVTGFDPRTIKEGLSYGQDPVVKQAADGVDKFIDTMRQWQVDNGLMTTKLRRAFERVWGHTYIPYHRVGEMVRGSLTGKPRRNARTPWRRWVDSKSRILDPIRALVADQFSTVAAVNENKAWLGLMDLAKTHKAGSWMQVVAPDKSPVSFNLKQLRSQVLQQMEDAGIDFDPQTLDESFLDEMVQVWMPHQIAVGGKQYVTALRNGRREWLEITDTGLWEALMATGPAGSGPVVSFFRPAASLLRSTATMNLPFMIKNMIRDYTSAKLYSPTGYSVRDLAGGFVSIITKDDTWQRFLASGASQATFNAQDRDLMQRELQRLDPMSRQHWLADTVFHPIDGLAALRELTENATRVGVVKRQLRFERQNKGITDAAGIDQAIRQGQLSENEWHTFKKMAGIADNVMQNEATANAMQEQAPEVYALLTKSIADIRGQQAMQRIGVLGREVTQDFAKMGMNIREFNQITAFLGARIGGWTRAGEEVMAHPGRLGKRVAVYATGVAVLWALNKDDDEYDEVPGFEKAMYHHFPVPQELRDEGWGPFVRIPRPFEYGEMTNWIEAALDWKAKEDPNSKERMRQGILSNLLVGEKKAAAFQFLLMWAPNALLPAAEVATNYNTFRERNIVNPFDMGLEKVPGGAALQYNRWTSETAKALGRMLDYSPAKIDHLIYGYTSGIGRMGTDFFDRMLFNERRPSKGVADIPGMRALYTGSGLSASSASIDQFYRERDRLNGEAARIRRLYQSGAEDAAFNAADAAGMTIDVQGSRTVVTNDERRHIEASARKLRELRALFDPIYESEELSPREKQKQLDEIVESMVNEARFALNKPPMTRTQRRTPLR
jgi:hypothetical protein